ncbi:MAG: GDP-mannose 4,6-dehydratase, partial [Planctomycetota bacterium]|nr:GDP-mannose 4,6-dehydratase [Planctomycetota bacterium]
MRFFITGGSGFIGSHLATRLLDSGHQVEILDDLSTGSIDNIASLKDCEGFNYQVGSIDNEPLVAEMIDRADVVYHLAAAVGVFLIVEDPVQCIETNIIGTSVVLRHATKKKKKVFVASTSELYGKSDRVPYAEDDDLILGPTTHARWSYSASKAIDEFLSLAYYRQKDLPIVICRFFNTVGPRQVGRYGMVMPRFVHQALEGGPITVYGDGQQSRCFCDVGDVT